jgi:hypothetical protein
MQDLQYLLIGIVDGLAVLGVFAGLTWAAIHDGRDERTFRARTAPKPALAAAPAAA